MNDEHRPTIAENEKSPASEAADNVPFGPDGTKPEDERKPEPKGTADGTEPPGDEEGKPVVPPARSHH